MNGYWDTMTVGDKSFMCIADASTANAKGALCAEADIGPDESNKTYKTKTYSITAADVDAKLLDWTGLQALTDKPTRATKDYNFPNTGGNAAT